MLMPKRIRVESAWAAHVDVNLVMSPNRLSSFDEIPLSVAANRVAVLYAVRMQFKVNLLLSHGSTPILSAL
jgi:hypothetical protein